MFNGYKYIKLNDLLEDIGGNSNLSNKYISENPGKYPVYSAKTTGNMIKGCISSYAYDMECLQITSDGANAGTVIYRPCTKFSVGPATRVYYLKKGFKKSVYLKYLYYILKKILNSNEYSWTNKATRYKLNEILIPLPVNSKGEIDTLSQANTIQKYEQIDILSEQLLNYKKILNSFRTNLCNDIDNKYVKISNLFDLSVSTNSSKFTMGFINENQGNIPVYGAVNTKDFASYGYVKDNLPEVKYFENCLTYNIDASAGYVFYRTGRFSLSEKVRPLIINTKYQGKLYEPYLEYIIQPIFRANIRGRRGSNGENEFTKINKTIIQDLEIPIPIDKNGEIDILAQKEIAEKYQKLENIKQQVIKEIDKVLNINVEIQ